MLPLGLLLLATGAALLSAALIVALRPVLMRYALARPNARSSHAAPTPQGGGIAVLGAVVALSAAGFALAAPEAMPTLARLLAAAVLLGIVGAWDDIRPLPALPRLAAQFGAVALVVVGAPRLTGDAAPFWVEGVLATVAGVWFVNLVNFMDGIDGITVAEMAPITAAIAGLSVAGLAPIEAGLLAASLLGALIGFAPSNRPVAKLFLGDVGSLPIGLLVAWLLHGLAGARPGGFAAAVLLPLYYLADATLTLGRRAWHGERLWVAHRTHYYQRATQNGYSVIGVSGRVLGLNLILAALAALVLAWPTPLVQAGALALGAGLVAALLARFGRPAAPAGARAA